MTPDNPARMLKLLCLLWLGGITLRVTILAVPPVIPLIRTELGMSETQVGMLTGLPPVLFACSGAELVSAALTALNVGQIPASFLLLAVAGRLERAIWPHVVAAQARCSRSSAWRCFRTRALWPAPRCWVSSPPRS